MPTIIYLGAEDEKEAAGILFERGVPMDVEHATAAALTLPKPRIFFHKHEVESKGVPAHLEAEYQGLPDRLIKEHQEHAEAYQRVAYSYTDEKDEPKRQGALRQVEGARERIAAAEQMKRERQAKAKAASESEAKKAAKEAKAEAEAKAKAEAEAKAGGQ